MIMKIYLAGPMRGYKLYNFPLFDEYRNTLTIDGWSVVSPADLDRQHGFDPIRLPADHDWMNFDGFEECIQRDLDALRQCQAIALMPGWHTSVGARMELAEALKLNLRILVLS